jgi:hypothetical protein
MHMYIDACIYIYAVLGISSKYLEDKEEEEEEDYIDAFGNKIMPRDMTFLIRTSIVFLPFFFFFFSFFPYQPLCYSTFATCNTQPSLNTFTTHIVSLKTFATVPSLHTTYYIFPPLFLLLLLTAPGGINCGRNYTLCCQKLGCSHSRQSSI